MTDELLDWVIERSRRHAEQARRRARIATSCTALSTAVSVVAISFAGITGGWLLMHAIAPALWAGLAVWMHINARRARAWVAQLEAKREHLVAEVRP